MNKTMTKKYFEIYIDLEKAKSQNKIIIEGVEIYFPFKPYPPQEEYMKKVILTLSTQGNISTLESPTGTGKTLCLLCSVLGWLRKNKEKEIDIYYCTRTISQIKNIMKELNKTCYILNNSFLVSRKYTCPYYTKSERDTNDNIQIKYDPENSAYCNSTDTLFISGGLGKRRLRLNDLWIIKYNSYEQQ